MIILGLTGSIGMGKSTTAKMMVERAFPGTTPEGKVDRALLAKAVVGHPDAMKRLEAIVHPLVAQSRDRFLDKARNEAAPVVVLDIPLLFETGGEKLVDAIVVVSAAPEIQRQRVMERPGMTAEKFESLLAKQMPDAQKRERADYIVDSGHGIEPARLQVREILAKVATMAPKR
jgi:dephospho-CoA kinase